MSPICTEDGIPQVISRSGLAYVNEEQPDLRMNESASGSSSTTPTLPIKHLTPNAPSNLGNTKDVRGTGVPGATNISGLPG
eukprot:10016574-Prorocentrum_lima.AAC.1